MSFDIIVVGAGPAGLSTACRIRQLCFQHGLDLSVCVIEKSSEIGAHILSGAIIETSSLAELFPDWRQRNAPLETTVTEEELCLFYSERGAFKIPGWLIPDDLKNHGNHIVSLGDLCRWLGTQAELLGVEILTGFAATEILFGKDDCVTGIATGDMGRDKKGNEKPGYTAGYELHAKYTVLAEGCRGHLGKQLIKKFGLSSEIQPQHYAIGIKELWEVPSARHRPGKVVHATGWPLGLGRTTGGSFLYHMDNNQIAVGLVCDLNYANPWLSPFDEFQRLKHHPQFSTILSDGKRIAFGAKALVKGGIQSLPQLGVPGMLLVGDNAGFLNFAKLKGTHTAIKSGLLAAESIVDCELAGNNDPTVLHQTYAEQFRTSGLYRELFRARNAAPALHRFGTLGGMVFNFIDQTICKGKLPLTLYDRKPDYSYMNSAADSPAINYPKPDNTLSFDRASSVYLSNISHDENQPCHLAFADGDIPLRENLPRYAEPAQRYCPAGVYEIVTNEEQLPKFQINSQNCIHCKTCDIKDPSQNITWLTPEGGSGPNYPNM